MVQGTPRKLIEAVAEDIAQQTLAAHPRVTGLSVAVTKPHVCIAGTFDSMGIEIFRSRR